MKYRWLIWTLATLLSLPVILGLQGLVLHLPGFFAQINVPIIFLSISLLVWKNGGIVWYAAAVYAVFDLYTATPFGLVLYAGTLAMLVVFWLYRAIITNQGIFAAALVTGALVLAWNILYALGRVSLHIFLDIPFSGSAWLALGATELLVTVLTAVLLYAVLAKLIPALKVTHARNPSLYG